MNMYINITESSLSDIPQHDNLGLTDENEYSEFIP